MPDPYSSEVYGVPPSGGVSVPNFRRRPARRPDEETWVSEPGIEHDAQAFQRALVGGEDPRFNEAAVVPSAGPRAAAFMARLGPTVLDNDRAGRVAITGNEAMTPAQRSRVVDMARSEQGYKRPLTGTNLTTGESFVMPAGGPRVSQAKAKSFLDLAAQEDATAMAKAERDRAFQAEQTARQAAADRQARLDEMTALDRRENRIANRDTRERSFAREDYTFGRQKAEDTRRDQSRLTPEQERQANAYQKILDNPNASARAKAMATQALASMGGIDAKTAAELGRPSAQANAAPVMDAINNDPLIAGRVQELKRAVTEAQDLPWYKDLANAATLGFYEGQASTPEVQQIQSEVDQMAQSLSDQYGLDLDAARQAILNQILPELTNQTPGVTRQIRGALRRPGATSSSTSAPFTSTGSVASLDDLPGGGPAF